MGDIAEILVTKFGPNGYRVPTRASRTGSCG